MATIMEMPKLSDTMKEGAIARWLKKEGEKVQVGQPIVEIETDKATMEYESPAGGVLLKILVGDGQSSALRAPIAVIGKPEENWEQAVAAAGQPADAKGSKESAKAKGGAPQPQAPGTPQLGKATQPSSPSTKPSTSVASANPPSSPLSGRIKASPLAKKVAQDKGIDLGALTGSGPGGRIVLRDVEGAQAPDELSTAVPTRAATAEITRVPLSMMRKTIAQRLTESVSQAPHFYLTISMNVGNLLAWRKQANAKLPEENRFSVNDLLVFLVARALKKHPNLNASWQGDHIAQYGSVHMGIAVALPQGLVTPVLRQADALNIVDIARRSRDLIRQAREGKLQPPDYTGGTFTISNLGMNGIEEFTAIINPPQAAILAVGATVPTPVVDEMGGIKVEQRMKVTLSCDHRVVDGFVGSEFLKTLKSYAEDPMNLFFF